MSEKLVKCRYSKCKYLHSSNELKKEDAVKGGSKNSYYHPDCWEISQTINQIKTTFCEDVDPTLTSKQIGSLMNIINNLVYSKGIAPDYILFALNYYIKNKPGSLRYPGGIAYIVQNKDVQLLWENEQKKKVEKSLKEEMKKNQNVDMNIDLDLPDKTPDKLNNRTRFSSVLGL